MRNFKVSLLCLFFLSCQDSVIAPPPSSAEVSNSASQEMLCNIKSFEQNNLAYPSVDRIIIVIFENEDGAKTLSVPFFNELIKQGAYFSNYHALYHPSQPNYFAITGGSSFEHYSNLPIDLDEPNLADLIEQGQKQWQVFAEDFPGNCYLGQFAEPAGIYSRKHNPLISFKNISGNPERCKKITNASSFIDSWKNNKLPHFSLYIPNNKNNGHDTGVEFAAQWVKKTFGDLLSNSTLMKNTLLIFTFDEDSAQSQANQNKVYTLFIGPMVKTNFVTNICYNHFSLLRTIEELWGLGSLNQFDKTANPIIDVWKDD